MVAGGCRNAPVGGYAHIIRSNHMTTGIILLIVLGFVLVGGLAA
jgi:hypothetical protein